MPLRNDGASPGDKRSASDSPFKDKRPRVEDPDASSQPWFHSVGMGTRFTSERIKTDKFKFLTRNGYFLHDSGNTNNLVLVYLCRDTKPLLLEAGPLNLIFINDYMRWSGAEVDADLEFFSNGCVTGSMFKDFAPALRAHLDRLGVVGEAANIEIIRMFRSNQIVENCHPDSMRVNFSKKPSPESEFVLKSGDICLPTVAGYWRVKIPRIEHTPTAIPHNWEEALKKAKFSYRFFPKEGDLFFSNTEGAKFGLPPTAQHLGLPKLELGLESHPDHVKQDPNLCDCASKDDEIRALQALVTDLLARKKTPGAFRFSDGITQFSMEGQDISFKYSGKVVIKK